MEYPEQIQQIYNDIKDLKVQGATNVAISTIEGMKKYLTLKDSDIKNIILVGNHLAFARPNEPLAQNAVVFVEHFFRERKGVELEEKKQREMVEDLCDEYLDMIADSKSKILEKNTAMLSGIDHVLNHCHSSTAVSLIKSIAKGDSDFTVVCTETRPKYQGRKTAKSLLEAQLDTTLIADSAAESFAIGRGNVPVDAVFIGCDLITMEGDCVNKIGSWGIALAAHQAGKPVYVVTPLLKLDYHTKTHNIEIEVREDNELWDEAPKGLKMYNPAFEVVDNGLITGFVTEYGILKTNEIADTVEREYSWLFDAKEDI